MSRKAGARALSPRSMASTGLPLIQVVGAPSCPLTHSPTQRRPQPCSAHATLVTGIPPSSPHTHPPHCRSCQPVLHHRDHRRNLRRCLLFILTLIVIFCLFLKHKESCSFLPAPLSSLARACVFCSSLLR